MLSSQAVKIDVHQTHTKSGVDFTINDPEVESVDFQRRINRRKDQGTIVIHNDDGKYSTSPKSITLGDRLDVYVAPADAPTEWEAGSWGYGGYSGYRLYWSARVEDPEYVRTADDISDLVLSCSDYVFSVLSDRFIFNAFEDRQISGTEDAILETVLDEDAPEIDRSRIKPITKTTSIRADGTNLLEFIIKLTRRADVVLRGFKNYLIFEPLSDVTSDFTVDPGSDISTFAHQFKGGTVKNVVRVIGGENRAVDDEQPNQTAYQTIDETNRLTFQIETRKSQLSEIELWTKRTGSNGSVIVRIQKDDGGAPIAINDSESDIVSKQLNYRFIDDDGFTSFLMSNHTLPEPNPWVIVETDGTNDQKIGIDDNGDPTFRAYYPYPITVEIKNQSSINQHGRKEKLIKQDNVSTLKEAKAIANEELDHYSEPESELTDIEPISRRMHRVDPGEIVTLPSSLDRERAAGDYMVIEASDTFAGSSIETSLTLKELSTI